MGADHKEIGVRGPFHKTELLGCVEGVDNGLGLHLANFEPQFLVESNPTQGDVLSIRAVGDELFAIISVLKRGHNGTINIKHGEFSCRSVHN